MLISPFTCSFFFLSNELFSLKYFSATTWLRILKCITRLDSDELYCLPKEQLHNAYQSLHLVIFLSLQWIFCHIFLSFYWSQCFVNFVYAFRQGRWNVYMKNKVLIFILPSFSNFQFSFCHSYKIHMNIFSFKDFSATTWLRILILGTKLDSDELYCITKTATYCLSVPLFVHFSFSPMKMLQISQRLLESVFSNFVYTLYCVNEN